MAKFCILSDKFSYRGFRIRENGETIIDLPWRTWGGREVIIKDGLSRFLSFEKPFLDLPFWVLIKSIKWLDEKAKKETTL